MTKLILATTSPYRQQAFRMIGVEFTPEASGVDEHSIERPESPEELVLFLAKLKADAVAKKHSSGIIIGFDSIGYFDGSVLEKPKTREEAFQRLRALSGKSGQFYTGNYLIDLESGKTISRVVITDFEMREITNADINKYLDQDPGFNTYCLGFDTLNHFSSTFIKKINGSYNNIVRGVSTEVIMEMLSEIGYEHNNNKLISYPPLST